MVVIPPHHERDTGDKENGAQPPHASEMSLWFRVVGISVLGSARQSSY